MTRSSLFHRTRKRGLRIPRWLQRSLLIFTLLWLLLSLWQAPVVRLEPDTQELRGVWMTNFGAALMYYTTRMDEVMAHIAGHRLNTLYPAVWNRGYTLHPSIIALQAGGWSRNPSTSLPLLPFQDALSGLIYQAHRQHLRRGTLSRGAGEQGSRGAKEFKGKASPHACLRHLILKRRRYMPRRYSGRSSFPPAPLLPC